MAGAVSTYYSTTTALASARNPTQRNSVYCYNLHTTPNRKRTDTMRRRSTSYCHRPLPAPPVMQMKRCSISVPLSKQQMSHFSTPPPSLYPKEQVDPLSLQDNTFLYILSQVEQYPAEILSKLPLAWRRRLLSAMPPFRLYQLEKTSVSDGIDTYEIWEELSKLKNSVWASYMKDDNNELTSSQTSLSLWDQHNSRPNRHSLHAKFVDYLTHLLFNEMNRDYACKRITELLHATHVDMLDETVANALIYGHINSLFMFIPPYCLVPFRCPNLTERELYWSLYGNRMLPTSLEIYTYNLDASPLWNQDIISQEMMRRILSKLQFLRIYNHKNRTEQLENLANAVTNSSKYKEPPSFMGSLKHLEILRTDYEHLTAIVPYFTSPNGYCNLTSLTISMQPLRYVQATTHLGPLIRNQLDSLQHLHLQGLSCCITRNVIHVWDYIFFTILASFILKQRFCSLVLCHFKELPWKLVQMLLEANLRTVPSHKQSLIFRDGTITGKGEAPFSDTKDSEDEEGENQFYPAAESKCLEHKCIHFQNTSIPIDALEWFEQTERLCIHSLEFNKVNVNPTSYLGTDVGIRAGNTAHRHQVTQRKTAPRNHDSLKMIFANHKHFECPMFTWTDVQLKPNLLNV